MDVFNNSKNQNLQTSYALINLQSINQSIKKIHRKL